MNRNFDRMKILKESLEINNLFKSESRKPDWNESLFINNMRVKYPELATDFSSILNISCGKSYDYDRLNQMLKMSEKVRNKEITQHDADVKVGQILVDDVVKPQLKNKNKRR
jgi:hypothetical protein